MDDIIRGFLVAVIGCCQQSELKIPGSVTSELSRYLETMEKRLPPDE